MAKIHLDDSNYKEFIDEIATQMTEIEFKEHTFIWEDDISFLSEEAENFYNEKYDEVETLLNNILNIHSNNKITDEKDREYKHKS